MTATVFIDGEAGTTGLQIRDRLLGRSDIQLIQIDPDRRKDPSARREAFAAADVAILCLPDAAAVEAVALCEGLPTRIIDASTAYRVNPDWAYGFAELSAENRSRIAEAKRVSNPGCYPTGSIALLAPLVAAGVIAPDAPLSINAVSGYSGGGKALIAEFDEGTAGAFFLYGLDHNHKHLPEITQHSGLMRRPIFVPSVGNFAQGMIVSIPLHLPKGKTAAQLRDILAARYEGSRFVSVLEESSLTARVDPERLNGSNRMELSVYGSAEGDRVVLLATLDNLGKGASGAAVQNLNLMLGMDEGTGL